MEFAKKWSGPNLKELQVGQKVIIVGTPSDASIASTRTVKIISQEE